MTAVFSAAAFTAVAMMFMFMVAAGGFRIKIQIPFQKRFHRFVSIPAHTAV